MTDHTYVDVAKFQEIVRPQEVIELSDLYDPDNGAINSAKVLAELVAASRVADSYLRVRYTTPVIPTPGELIWYVVAIARYRLTNLAGEESRVYLDYKDAINRLKELAAGLTSLDVVAGDDPQPPTSEVYSVPGLQFDLNGFSDKSGGIFGY